MTGLFKSKNEDYIDEAKIKIDYNIVHPCPAIRNRIANSFHYYDAPAMGLGEEGRPFIEADDFVDLSNLDKIQEELQNNIGLATESLVHMIPFGLIPEGINDEKCLDAFLLNPLKYGIENDNFTFARKITNFHALKRYYVNKFGLTKSWKRVLHLRTPLPFYEKGNPSTWLPIIQHFPYLRQLAESLPFKHMGIGLIFRSNEDTKLLIHRDSYLRNHSMHHLNVSLSKDSRNVFIYDPIKNIRHYLNPSSRCYTFNECDLHGADPQFDHLVLRIDGQFQDWFADHIGLKNGVSFDWAYDRPQEQIKQSGPIKVWNETDV